MHQDQHACYLRILVKCWEDPAFRAALLAEPRRVLEAEGVALPKGDVHVVEDSADAIYLVLPPNPGEGERSDAALETLAAASAEAVLDRFRAFRDQWQCSRPDGATVTGLKRCSPEAA